MFHCTNDKYCLTPETFDSVDDFQAMATVCFGAPVELHQRHTPRGTEWLDESGEVVLREGEAPAVTVD